MIRKHTFEDHFNSMSWSGKVRFANRRVWGMDLDFALLRGSWTEVPAWLKEDYAKWVEIRDALVWEGVDVRL